MSKESVVRQYFRDLIENTNFEQVNIRDGFDNVETTEMVVDLFFSGKMELKWNPEKHQLMLKAHDVAFTSR